MDQEKVGKFIAKLRKEKNITQSQLADKLGTNVKTISRWETGATLFDISYLKQLCDIFEINELELLKGERLKEFEDIKNQKKKIIRKASLICICIVILFLLIIMMLMFKYNYNNCYIYTLMSKNKDFLINGVIINTPEKDIISLNSIENLTNFDLDIEIAYAYEYSLLSNNEIIYSNGDISLYVHDDHSSFTLLNDVIKNIKLYIEEDSNYNDVIRNYPNNNLLLKIKYIDKDLKQKELEIDISYSLIFSNNRIIYENGKKF